MACIASTIGISIPSLRARPCADAVVRTPSAMATIPHGRLFATAVLVAPFFLVAFSASPSLAVSVGKVFAPITRILENKYYFDWFNENVLAAGARLLGRGLWKGGDQGLIDGLAVNGSARVVGVVAGVVRLVQTGHLYWYALVMILGVFGLLTWQLLPYFQSIAH